MKEQDVEFFSNNLGVECIGFSGDAINVTFHTLREALDGIYDDVVEEEREAAKGDSDEE